jgi:hypothetical protein
MSTGAVLLGAQVPRVKHVPPSAYSLGNEAVDLMREVGKPLLPWQANEVRDALGLRTDGYWAAFEVVELVARQNGKGAVTEGIEIPKLFLFGERLIMHSAHLFKTAKQSFDRIVEIIDNSDWLRRRVKHVKRARGDEEIELLGRYGGGRLMYFSRSAGAGRGFTGDTTVFDECQYLTIEQYQAATPTLATVANPQIVYTGTPPDEDVGPMPEDAMMPSVRKRGHAGGDRIMLSEWSPPEGYDRTDPRIHAMCNPSYGDREDGGLVAPWFLAQQLENFTAAGKPGKFDTEHLGLWPPDADELWAIIAEQRWSDALDVHSAPVDPVVFSISMNYRRTWATIALCGARADGDLHIEVPPMDHRAGTGWLIGRALELHKRWKPMAWVIDPGGPAGALIPDLQGKGIEVTLQNARSVAHGFGLFYDGHMRQPGEVVKDEDGMERPVRRIWHRDDPTLTRLVAEARTRRVGMALSWQEPTDGDISPLVAATGAVWGFCSLPAPEKPNPPISVNQTNLTGSAALFRPTTRLKL